MRSAPARPLSDGFALTQSEVLLFAAIFGGIMIIGGTLIKALGDRAIRQQDEKIVTLGGRIDEAGKGHHSLSREFYDYKTYSATTFASKQNVDDALQRLVRVETQVTNIKEASERIEDKLDAALKARP